MISPVTNSQKSNFAAESRLAVSRWIWLICIPLTAIKCHGIRRTLFSSLSLPVPRGAAPPPAEQAYTGQAGQGRAGCPQDPPATAAPLGPVALLLLRFTQTQTGLLHAHPWQCPSASVPRWGILLPDFAPGVPKPPVKEGPSAAPRRSTQSLCLAPGRSGRRWRAERGGAASEGRALPGRVPACEHAAPGGGGGIPRPGRGRFAPELAPGREEERALPEAAERRRRWEPAVPRGQRCSRVTAAGARLSAGREPLRGGGSRASSRRCPAFPSALGAVSRRGPRSVPPSLHRRPGGCGRHRCHGAAHAGVQ